jgi:4-amino-4-deoxy-L-arabinose transferase-like glycosyltransferase
MSPRTKLLIAQLAVLLAICVFLYFFALGAFGLVGADEPRYAQIAREMLARHDWIVPTLNGQPWLEKPVLLYWREMIEFSFFGVQDFAARIPSAANATALAIIILFFMRRFRPGSELDAALMAASCAAMIGFGRGASTDMLLAAPFCVAMLAWWTWHELGNKLWLAVFYATLAIGALAKGPISPVLAVLIVAAYAWLRGDAQILLRSLWPAGFAVFLALALPWYLAVQMKVPQFFKVFFLEHNLERFGTNLYQHSQPFWYYIPVFMLSVLPWTVFTLPALWDALRNGWQIVRGRNHESAAQPVEPDCLSQFLLLWILVPIALFSISRSKLPGYVLPAIPAAAMLTAAHLHAAQKIERLKLMLHSLVCGALMAGALLAPWFMLKAPVAEGTRIWVAIISGVIAVAVLLVVRYRGMRVLHFITLVPIVLGLVFLLRFASIPADDAFPYHGLIVDLAHSARPVNGELRRLGVISGPVAVFNVKRDVEYGLNFYRNEPIPRYERDGVPAQDHVVIAKSGSEAAVRALAEPRKVTPIGGFAPQRLQFFKITNSK